MMLVFIRRDVFNVSYVSVIDFITAGEKSLANKNYWSALSVALTLPSMCSRIYFADNQDQYRNFKWKNKNDHNEGKIYTDWKDKECYIDFCNSIMCVHNIVAGNSICNVPDGYLTAILGDRYSELLYTLRCDILHAGAVNIYDDGKGIFLILGEFSKAIELTKYRMIPIKDLCETIFNYVKIWYNNFGIYYLKNTYVFDTENNSDDVLLLDKLCSDDRAEYLKQKFEIEYKNRNNTENNTN